MTSYSSIRDEPLAENNLAPFTPTMSQVQSISIAMMALTSNDVLFDLGCGDGRLLVSAAEATPGIRCVGIELDPVLVHRALQAVQSLSRDIAERIDIRHGDVLDLRTLNGGKLTFMDDATAIFLFLMPRGLKKITPLMEQLARKRKDQGKPFRVISYIFSIQPWKPVMVDKTTKGDVNIYLYELSSIPFTTQTMT